MSVMATIGSKRQTGDPSAQGAIFAGAQSNAVLEALAASA
jgi:hypothetical protein